jgi:recombinational DNA repair protein (RecF pathway)
VTTERWDDNRLDQLAEIVEANSRDIVSLRESLVATNRAVLTTNQNVNQLITAMQEQQEANTQVFQMLIQEIRGLRSENRKILTYLFGEQSE